MIVLETPAPVVAGELQSRLAGSAEVRRFDELDREALARIAADIQVVVARGPMYIGSAFMEELPNLRLIAALGSGVDHIDVAEARRRGIVVTSNPGVAPEPVAEYVMATMVLMRRRLPELSEAASSGRWGARLELIGDGLRGAILGVVGLGAIGSEVAKMGRRAYGMQVWAIDHTAQDHEYEEVGARRADSLSHLLSSADVVSLHVPLTDKTRHLLGEPEIAQIKPGAILINASRGGIVDEGALVTALSEGHIGGAVIDCLESEPPDPSNQLLHLRNVFVTPHVAGLSRDGLERLYAQTASMVRTLSQDGSLEDAIGTSHP